MKNKFEDLNNHLFAQLERLGDEDLDADKIEQEVSRTKAIVEVADRLAGNARLQLDAAKLVAEHGSHLRSDLPMIGTQPKTIEGSPK